MVESGECSLLVKFQAAKASNDAKMHQCGQGCSPTYHKYEKPIQSNLKCADTERHAFCLVYACAHFRYNCRMAKTAKWLNAILEYVRNVKSSISMVFGLVS